MGIDVHGHITNKFGVKEVVEFLASQGLQEVRWESTHSPGYYVILLVDGKDKRTLHFHTGGGIFGSHLVSLRKWGNAESIVKSVVDQFSGVFVPNDCEAGAVLIDQGSYVESESIFVLRWALARGIVEDSSVESVIKASEAFEAWLRR